MNQLKPSDYRIGNWVMYDNRYFQLHVIADEIPSLNTDEFGIGVVSWKSIQPIPLTPEILENCGFTKMNNGWNMGEHKSYMDVIFSLFDDNYCQGELDLRLNGSDLPMPKVKYLHQLQNLYYALTGEELFFKTNILQCILEKLKTRSYYLSWWLRLDLNNKYPTAKINYELKKAVKEGLLVAVSHRHGIEYSLPSIIDNKK